jgi:hypothetical protein
LFLEASLFNLSSGSRLLLLDVELVEVLLDGTPSEDLAGRDTEHRAHGGIRDDGVLLTLELVLIDVDLESLGHIGGGHHGTRLLAEELGEGIGEAHRDHEDRRLALGGVGLRALLLDTLALLGGVHILGVTLLEALEGGDRGNSVVLDRGELIDGLRDLLREGLLGHLGGGSGLGHRGGSRNGSRSGSLGGLGCSRALDLLHGLGGSGGHGSGGSSGRSLSLLSNALGNSSLGGSSGSHRVSTGGNIRHL